MLDQLLEAKAGARTDGAWRTDLGAITIDWGRPGDPLRQYRGGWGLSHIIARRTAEGLDAEAWIRQTLPEVLLHGQPVRVYGAPDALRVDLRWQEHQLTLSLAREGQRENWVVAGAPTRSAADGAGAITPTPPAAPAAGTAPGAQRFQVFTPTGRALLVEPRVVELDQLVVSHSPDGVANPAYPHAEGLQPRDRGAAPSQDQVREIAARLIPERLLPNREAGFGAPLVGPDLVVESGNARSAALMLVYRDPALTSQRDAYRAMLEAAGYDVAKMREPVVVSVRLTPLTPAERVASVAEHNNRAIGGLSVTEQAAADSRALGEVMDLYRGGDIEAAANAEFRLRWLDRLGAAERMGLEDSKGQWTAEATRRLRTAMLARAYGDALGPLLGRFLAGDNEGYRGLARPVRAAHATCWTRSRPGWPRPRPPRSA